MTINSYYIVTRGYFHTSSSHLYFSPCVQNVFFTFIKTHFSHDKPFFYLKQHPVDHWTIHSGMG